MKGWGAMEPESVAEKFRALDEEATRQREQLREVVARVTALRKEGATSGLSDSVRMRLEAASEEAQAILDSLKRIEVEMMELVGLTEEMIESIEDELVKADEVDHTSRGSVSADRIAPTAELNDAAPEALEQLLRLVDPAWLNNEAAKTYGLGPEILTAPLLVVRGVRVESHESRVHRFAQMLLVTRDFVSGESTYDFFEGALLVPQVVALGGQLDVLKIVGGEVDERIRSLWRYGTDTTDATVYELLVAAACARWGCSIEFLEAGRGRTGQKTPDLRVHGYPFPVVVECKRRDALTDADFSEAKVMRELFSALRAECARRGLWGVFDIHLSVTPELLPQARVLECAMRQPYARDPSEHLEYEWGKLAFQELSRQITVPETRLYSPIFLETVFGWNTDIPPHDGLVCQVRDPGNSSVSEAKEPLAIVWTNENPGVFRRRARTASGLYGSALRQVGAGEVGIVYVCYQEGDRESVADDRTRYMTEQLREWDHDWTIRVPISVLTRIIPRPLGHGAPDMIETGIRYLSGLYGDPVWFQSFPTRVFTSVDEVRE
jgi:hypothetical protein